MFGEWNLELSTGRLPTRYVTVLAVRHDQPHARWVAAGFRAVVSKRLIRHLFALHNLFRIVVDGALSAPAYCMPGAAIC